MKYLMEIFWSEEDQGYIAIVPELSGCSAWGETPEEAVLALQDAAKTWLEAYTSMGELVPEPKVTRRMWPRV